jgi:hypothetical protein
MKIPLSEALQEYQLMDILECVRELGWKTEFPAEEFEQNGTGKITCSCGAGVKTGGWIGQEHAWCPECHKGMQDMCGLLPESAYSVTFIDSDKVEMPQDGRTWTPKNIWGL